MKHCKLCVFSEFRIATGKSFISSRFPWLCYRHVHCNESTMHALAWWRVTCPVIRSFGNSFYGNWNSLHCARFFQLYWVDNCPFILFHTSISSSSSHHAFISYSVHWSQIKSVRIKLGSYLYMLILHYQSLIKSISAPLYVLLDFGIKTKSCY